MLKLAGLWLGIVALCGCSDGEPSRGRAPLHDSGVRAASDAEVIDAQAEPPPLDLYVSADGDAAAPGTREAPTSLTAAIERVTPGHTIYLRGGTYRMADTLRIASDRSGASDAPKTLSQNQREAPLLDFSGQAQAGQASRDGLRIEADHWRVVGLIVRGATAAGITVTGSDVQVERCAMFENGRAGLQLGASDEPSAPSDVSIIDCESFDNHDLSGENLEADGFRVMQVGPGNLFRGCVAHHNLGDGWDLSRDSSAVTIDQSVAHTNGLLTDGTRNASREAKSNGFTLGSEVATVAHTVTRSIAYYNDLHGFSSGGNAGALRLINTLAFENTEGNYELSDAAALMNDVSVWVQTGAARDDRVSAAAGSSNRFWLAAVDHVAASEFADSLRAVKLTRSMEGDLDFSAFALNPGSSLIDAGVIPEGMLPFDPAYYRGNPDLGAVERE